MKQPSEPIAVGDLVCVVRGHICDLGRTGIVTDLYLAHGWSCRCGVEGHEREPMATLDCQSQWEGELVSWLRRIPPLSHPAEARETEAEGG